jgi:hypothetical protein
MPLSLVVGKGINPLLLLLEIEGGHKAVVKGELNPSRRIQSIEILLITPKPHTSINKCIHYKILTFISLLAWSPLILPTNLLLCGIKFSAIPLYYRYLSEDVEKLSSRILDFKSELSLTVLPSSSHAILSASIMHLPVKMSKDHISSCGSKWIRILIILGDTIWTARASA